MQDTQELTEVDAAEDAAFETSGFKAAVFKPMFAHAHQQVFTPRWLCDALPPIAEMVDRLEALRKLKPEHTGLNHYLIHAADDASNAARASQPSSRG